jgi:hypothetical protein
LKAPVGRLDLGPAVKARRAFRVESEDVRLGRRNGRDLIVPINKGARFSTASLVARPSPADSQKQYRPIAPLGEGVVIYTGHFWPYTDEGARYAAAFDLDPGPGANAVAFGQTAARLQGWRSPHERPAFVYAGPLKPSRAGAIAAIVDPTAPEWARKHMLALAPRLAGHFEVTEAPGAIDLFLAMGDSSEHGQLRYDGDALPGQILVTLSGGGWRESSDGAKSVLAAGTAHEFAHLAAMGARPRLATVPDWIHEGAAEAMGLEALAAIGWIDRDELANARDAARYDCAEHLRGRSLARAERAGAWRASYACGHVLALIAARARGESVLDFWRAFEGRAETNGGYDETLFFTLIAEAAGPRLARETQQFVRLSYAAPEKELLRLLDAADSATAP